MSPFLLRVTTRTVPVADATPAPASSVRCCADLWAELEPDYPHARCSTPVIGIGGCTAPDCACDALDADGLCEAHWLATK